MKKKKITLINSSELGQKDINTSLLSIQNEMDDIIDKVNYFDESGTIDKAKEADKVKGKLTIKGHVYDGSEDVDMTDIILPPGPQGPKGDKGDPGGPVGPMGPRGPKGDQGEQGIPGKTGATGIQGPKGDKGDKGERGPEGSIVGKAMDIVSSKEMTFLSGQPSFLDVLEPGTYWSDLWKDMPPTPKKDIPTTSAKLLVNVFYSNKEGKPSTIIQTVVPKPQENKPARGWERLSIDGGKTFSDWYDSSNNAENGKNLKVIGVLDTTTTNSYEIEKGLSCYIDKEGNRIIAFLGNNNDDDPSLHKTYGTTVIKIDKEGQMWSKSGWYEWSETKNDYIFRWNADWVRAEGPQGPRGYTWYPIVDDEGNISWVDNDDPTPPITKNIRGPQGIQGPQGSSVSYYGIPDVLHFNHWSITEDGSIWYEWELTDWPDYPLPSPGEEWTFNINDPAIQWANEHNYPDSFFLEKGRHKVGDIIMFMWPTPRTGKYRADESLLQNLVVTGTILSWTVEKPFISGERIPEIPEGDYEANRVYKVMVNDTSYMHYGPRGKRGLPTEVAAKMLLKGTGEPWSEIFYTGQIKVGDSVSAFFDTSYLPKGFFDEKGNVLFPEKFILTSNAMVTFSDEYVGTFTKPTMVSINVTQWEQMTGPGWPHSEDKYIVSFSGEYVFIGQPGFRGIQGKQGEKGDKGDKGPQGVFFRPCISKDGVLSWQIEENDPIVPDPVNVIGPQGLKGDKGDKGDQGLQGIQGEVGPQGPKGDTGPKGFRGSTWYPTVDKDGNITWKDQNTTTPPESANIKGDTGPIGPRGPRGPQGDKGATWLPSVDDKGNISWSKDENSSETNPPKIVNITGPKGVPGRNVQIVKLVKGTEKKDWEAELGKDRTAVVELEENYLPIEYGDAVYFNAIDINKGPCQIYGEASSHGGSSPFIPTNPKIENATISFNAGPQGEKGDTGEKGEVGTTWKPTVTLEGDISWTADASTAEPTPRNIKGPKGDKGDTGEKGDQGIQGEEGPQGLKGETGPQGETGPKGERGPIGPGLYVMTWKPGAVRIPTSIENEIGKEVEIWWADVRLSLDAKLGDTVYFMAYKGYISEDVKVQVYGTISSDPTYLPDYVPFKVRVSSYVEMVDGPRGPAGPEGPQGIPGPEGPRGDKGERGEPGPMGPMGPQGPAGGPMGPQGIPGKDGKDGKDGERGPQGPRGFQGPQGEVGPKGDTGPIGPQGPKGEQGLKGDTGTIGPIGPEGPKGEDGGGWYPAVSTDGDISWTYNNSKEVPTTTNIKGPQGAVGPQGDRGEKGPQGDGIISIQVINKEQEWEVGKRFYDIEYNYASILVRPEYGNTVVFDGIITGQPKESRPLITAQVVQNRNNKLMLDVTSIIDLTVGAKGDKGDQGIQGIQGPIGPIGPQGPKGDASTVPGPQGPIGPEGPKGEKGDKGDASTVPGPRGATWYPTVAENGDITWVDSDTTTAPTMMNIKGPQGDTGPIGPQGPAGPAGGEEPENLWQLKKAPRIPENADLNTYTEPGSWVCVQGKIGATVKNKPYQQYKQSDVNVFTLVNTTFSYKEDVNKYSLTQHFYPWEYGHFMRTYDAWTEKWSIWHYLPNESRQIKGVQTWGMSPIPDKVALTYDYRKNFDNQIPNHTGWGSGVLTFHNSPGYGAELALGSGLDRGEIHMRSVYNGDAWGKWLKILTELDTAKDAKGLVYSDYTLTDPKTIKGLSYAKVKNADVGLPEDAAGPYSIVISMQRWGDGGKSTQMAISDSGKLRIRISADKGVNEWTPWEEVGPDYVKGTLLNTEKLLKPSEVENVSMSYPLSSAELGLQGIDTSSKYFYVLSFGQWSKYQHAFQIAFGRGGQMYFHIPKDANNWWRWYKTDSRHAEDANVLKYFDFRNHTLPLPQTCDGMQYQLALNTDLAIPSLSDGDTTKWSLVVSIQKWQDKTGGSPIQLAIQDDGKIFFRMGDFTANTWGEWQRYLKDDDAPLLKGAKSIEANGDLNNYTKPGTWQIDAYAIGNTVKNLPNGSAHAGTIVNMGYAIQPNGEWQMTQYYLDLNGLIFSRAYKGYRADPNSRWGVWYKTAMTPA